MSTLASESSVVKLGVSGLCVAHAHLKGEESSSRSLNSQRYFSKCGTDLVAIP